MESKEEKGISTDIESDVKSAKVTESSREKDDKPSAEKEFSQNKWEADKDNSENQKPKEEENPKLDGHKESSKLRKTEEPIAESSSNNITTAKSENQAEPSSATSHLSSSGEDTITGAASSADRTEIKEQGDLDRPVNGETTKQEPNKEKAGTEQPDSKSNPEQPRSGEATEDSEDEGIDDIGTTEELDHTGRDAMFERGVQFEKKQKKNLALKCYLQCLKGLSNTEHFSFLPQCLRKIADIYFEKEELEKAIQFIQAEKMFYETALIDTNELQKKLEERKTEQSGEGKAAGDEKTATPEIVRADEYEKLARMCLKQGQPQLALEYQGKATKLRQDVYGSDHEVTAASLDFFTVIYGEVGKQQYSESMQKLSSPPEVSKSSPETPQSILRKRKTAEKDESPEGEDENKDENKDEKKKVRFAESSITREQEEWISHKLLLLLLLFSVLVCVILGFYIYCKTHVHSDTCASWKTEVFYYYMRVKYFYHYYFASGKNQVVG